MYQKPDFVKISLKVKDVFANYTCTPIGGGLIAHTDTDITTVCSDSSEVFNYVTAGFGNECYLTPTA